MSRASLSALVMTAFPLAVAAQNTPELIEVTYRCERGVTIPAVYVNAPEGPGHMVALIEGRLTVLTQAISASGGRYREAGPDAGYELWGKGDGATLGYGTEDATQPLLVECVAIRGDDSQ